MRAIRPCFSFISTRPRATFKGAAGRIWRAGRHLTRPGIGDQPWTECTSHKVVFGQFGNENCTD